MRLCCTEIRTRTATFAHDWAALTSRLISWVRSWLGPKQAVGLLLLAVCCAVAFHTRVYKQFDRIRIKVVDAEQPPAGGLMVVLLPDAARLADTWTAVVLRLANRSPDTRIVRITIGTTPIDRVILRPGQTSRVDLGGLVRWDADINDRLVLRSNGGGWVLEYLELANVHGFNSGLFSFVVVPDRVMPADRPPKAAAVFVFLMMLALPLALRPFHRKGTGDAAAMAVSATALCFLGVTLVLPFVSPYKVLLSVQAFWLCVATIYGSPVAPRAAGVCARWLTAGFGVLWRRGIGPALRFGKMLPGRVARWLTAGFGVLWRRGIGPALRFGTDLALWPAAAARCLAASRRRILVGAIGVLVASTVALSWLVPTLRSTPPTYPEGDTALLEIYTLHASHGDLSIGPYSRFTWNHPGPAYFYALAPLHALTDHEFSLHWTVLLLNLASAVAAVVLLGRYGGWPFGLGLMVVLSIYFFRPNPWGLRMLVDVWNPHAVMLPFAVLLVLCARLASGVITVLPWIVLVASFVAQTHIGVVPCTAAVTASAALLYFLRRRVLGRHAETAGTDPEGRPAAFWIHAAIWVFVLLWSLPLVEQLRAGPGGNLAHIVSFFVADSHSETPTMATSFNALSYALWVPIRGTAPTITDFNLSAAVWSVLQLVLLAAGSVWAALARRAFPAALCLVGLVAACAAFWSITQVRGGLGSGYLTYWIFMVSVVNTAALLGFVMDRAAGALSLHRLRVLSVAGSVAAGAFGILLTVQSALVLYDLQQRKLNENSYLASRVRVRVLFAAVEEDLRRHCRNRPLIRIQSNESWPEAAGVVLQLYKAGIPLAIDDRYLFMFTETFLATGVEDVEFLFTDVAPDVNETPPYRMVAQRSGTFVYARDVPGARRNASSLESGCSLG